MKLKQKHANITIDNIVDTDTLKALTTTAQEIAGQQTFSVAPRVLNPSPSPGERHLVTEAMLNDAIAAVIANGQNLNWEFLPDGGVQLVDWTIPSGIDFDGIPVMIIDGPKKYPLPHTFPTKPNPGCVVEYRKCGKRIVYSTVYTCGWESGGDIQHNQYNCRATGLVPVEVDIYEAVWKCP